MALPASHPLAKHGVIRARALRDEAFVMYAPEGGKYFHDRIAGLFASADVRVRPVQFIDQTHSIVALVRAGLGVAIVPSSARELGFRDVAFRPLWTADAYADLDLAWTDDPGHPAVETFRDFALAYFAQLPGESM